ncbi:MOB kinase activator-like 2 isoform X2 [Macrobrachium nipponense]|uniref:MOB kinase activator-like 2 isoform X2 n=1 Tax=Macrobrachium nipponense TaxID=159736 RepID=UPI0030C886A0
MLDMAGGPDGRPASLSSWASGSTYTSSCSWHSAYTPPPLAAQDGDNTHQWSNPAGNNPSAWPHPPCDDSPWSLPLEMAGVGWGDGMPGSPTPSDTAVLVKAARARRPSVVAALLTVHGHPPNLSRSMSTPADQHHQISRHNDHHPHYTTVDAGAFYKYYEGTVLGASPTLDQASASVDEGGISGTSGDTSHNNSNVCGGLVGGPLSSLAVAVPSKLEGLLKLFAQSLHLVLAAMCSRKARRKDRECSAAQEQEHKLYLEEAVLERKIPETDLRQLVELPPGLGYEEWLASHTIDFFQHINLLYGTVIEYCTMSGCPDMTGPTTRQYLWFDEKGKKTRVAAPQYVDYVMTFTQKTINDESIFPTKFENDFPVSFESIVKKIHRLLFHVLAHLYHSHFREMVLLNLHAHLNCIFAHFILFNERFRLIDEKETEVLKDLVVALKLHPESESSAASTTTTTASITTATTTTTTTTTTTSSCSQLGDPETSASPTNSSSNATTTPAMGNNTLSSDGDCGSCSTPQEQQSSCPSDTTAVSSNSSSGLLSALGDTAAGGSGPPLLDAGAALDTRP